MATGKKVKNTGKNVKGKIKETTGKAVGNESLEAKGKTEQRLADAKQAGQKTKDALT
ncbi:CsbD family protein [Streptomyces sp. NPDC059533]|uniref:CsbD family protein n=1 Tax=unclassified Streptomyces TaxID=2593676 RepID=UPI00367A1536